MHRWIEEHGPRLYHAAPDNAEIALIEGLIPVETTHLHLLADPALGHASQWLAVDLQCVCPQALCCPDSHRDDPLATWQHLRHEGVIAHRGPIAPAALALLS